MPENSIPLPMPWGGLSEHEAFADQPADTAREFQNVRIQDPRTGRRRISQRSGLSKYNDTGLGASKVSDLLSLFVDNRQVTYSPISSGSETITWATPTPSKVECRNVKTDRQGNVYALDGNAAIVKYSADGTKLWQFALPVKDPLHVLRGLFVDEFDAVYVSVSEGGNQETASFWRIDQLNENQNELAWTIDPKAYTEDMVLYQGRLYTIQNDTTRRRSFVRIYADVASANPFLDKEWRVMYPANSLAIKADGSVVIAAGHVASSVDADIALGFGLRPGDPAIRFSLPPVTDWTPRNLTDFDGRVWGWWVADDIEATDVAGDFKDGVEVLSWRDRTKNHRDWRAALEFGDDGPRLKFDGLGGTKALLFNKIGSAAPFQAMVTEPNYSLLDEAADGQRTSIPCYTPNSEFTIIFVLRPNMTQPDGDNLMRFLWGQDRTNTSASTDDHIIFINREASALPGTANAGAICYYTSGITSGGGGAGGQVRETDILNSFPTEFSEAIVALLYDSDAVTEGLFHVNADPGQSDAFVGAAHSSLYRSYLGFHRQNDGSAATTSTSGYLGEIYEIIVISDLVTHDNLELGDAPQSQTVNELTQLLGYIYHRLGIQFGLPDTGVSFPHPFGRVGVDNSALVGPPSPTGAGGSTSPHAFAMKRWGHVAKYSPDGRLVWCANEQSADDVGDGSLPGGFGNAVAVNPDGNIYSLGPIGEAITGLGSTGSQVVRMIVDKGSTFSVNPSDGAWSATIAGFDGDDYNTPKIDVDEFGNLYVPHYDASSPAASFRVYKKDGTLLHSKLLSASQKGYAVAVDRRIPDYRTDLDGTTKRAEHVFVATDDEGAITNATVHKVRLVNATQSGATPRTLTLFGVDAGDIKTFTTAAIATPTGGSGALDSTATYVQSTTLYKKAYWTDGRNYKRYDPVSGVISNFTSTSAGSIPPRCQLIESWRGRLVLARSADNPHNWFLSKKDEPNNWDYFPPVPTETDAVAGTFPNGTQSAAGPAPDIINTVVPYSQDILVFGCDHSIWMLVGDPAAGGRMELVSDITGMSFGRPWCKDPNGVLYFFGSKGGVFRWAPGAQPERVSVFKIERSLQDVNLGTHYVRLVYNYKDEGIHILVCPFGAGGTQVSHFFLELKQEAFSKDLFGTTTHTNVQPTAVVVIDGDAFDDRLVLFGCEDGFVRKWDPTAKSDDFRTDGETHIAIDSFVTIGPVQGAAEVEGGLETQFSGLTVILSDPDDGAKFELYATEEADSIGATKRSGMLVAGRNAPRWDKVTGPHCWIRLRNAASEERWSLERAYVYAAPAGLVRPR